MNALRTGFDKSTRRPGRCKLRRVRDLTPLTYDALLEAFEVRIIAARTGLLAEACGNYLAGRA